MDEFLAQLRADGTLEEIEEIWFGTDEDIQVVEDWTQLPATNGILGLPPRPAVPPSPT